VDSQNLSETESPRRLNKKVAPLIRYKQHTGKATKGKVVVEPTQLKNISQDWIVSPNRGENKNI